MKQRLAKLIPAGSLVLGITILISYLLGLVRDHYFAQVFGATRALDAYNAAFLIPDLLFNILVASGIAAAFIPILTELLKLDVKRANKYANSVITAAIGSMIITSIIIIIFADPISALVVPGFNPEDRALVAKILRLLSLSPIFFGISNAIGAMLVTKRRFLFYGLSPILYNLGIIGGTILLAPRFGITGVALGTVGGALLHFAVRFWDARRSGFIFSLNCSFRTAEFKQTLKLMLPKMLGHPIELATFWAFTAISSTLVPGSVAVMSFARNFESVPVSLIGITIATTTFPILALAIVDRSIDRFRKILKNSFLLIFFTSIAAALVTFWIKEPLVRIALGGGAFTTSDIARTAATLGMFTLAIPTEASIQLLARAFYATKNTIIPVALSVVGFVIAVGGAYLLVPRYDILALPLGFFIGSAVELIFLAVLISARTRRLFSSVSKNEQSCYERF
ncbi:MAG: MATE family efflux transporter [Candidatus Falkowbacteria bacterium]|nr:MATE family efflux transporter [Candidatus Falkowbacteria bacterium]